MRYTAGLLTPVLLFQIFTYIHASFDVEKALTNTCPGCFNGACVDGQCLCLRGWSGKQCDHCWGRVKITDNSSLITDGPQSYAAKSRCTWIIENEEKTPGPMTLRLENFSTECGWDYVYIYDGNGIYGEQLAAFCGNVGPKEVLAPSGSALVYFVSDLAEHKDGFNISYLFDKCPYDCHNHGKCSEAGCKCEDGFIGEFCETLTCTTSNDGSTGPCQNGGHCKNGKCECVSHFHGDFCQQHSHVGVWDRIITKGNPMSGRASHTSVLVDDVIWTVGGEHFSGTPTEMVVTFNVTSKTWTTIKVGQSKDLPRIRYDHTLVKHKNKVFMFGGVIDRKNITNELWSFDMVTRTWELVNKEGENPVENEELKVPPIAVSGHTAHVIENEMFVFFGYNAQLGFVHHIQIYNFVTKKWKFGDANDHVNGRFGHTSIVVDNKIALIYGGSTQGSNNITDSLMEYNFEKARWKYLTSSGLNVFLHSASLFNRMMIVVGGNGYNASGSLRNSDCFNSAVLAYDISCQTWYNLSVPPPALARYGHSSVASDDSIYILGGFNGQMLNDVQRFQPVDCTVFTKPDHCRSMNEGVRCYFVDKTCYKYDGSSSIKEEFISVIKNEQSMRGGIDCPNNNARDAIAVCDEQKDCVSCASQSGCGWCPSGHQCISSEQECVDGQMMLTTWEKCDAGTTTTPRPCSMAHDCYSCKLLTHCNWYQVDGKPSCITLQEEALLINEQRSRELERIASSLTPSRPSLSPIQLPAGANLTYCPFSCAEQENCRGCIRSRNCMWCPSTERCINMEAYTLSFAYGQCQSWVTGSGSLGSGGQNICQQESANCTEHKTCGECQLQPGCGWVDDVSKTGLGKCVRGNDTGPIDIIVDMSRWFFTTCPACQCNGHSNCANTTVSYGSPKCIECGNNTTGDHCQFCDRGYHGDPRNGGICQRCQCNGQADDCDNTTGQCYCTTKGVIGDHCEKCDQKYYGDPQNGKPCYYDLTVDFIFTFKLKSDERDKHAREIFLKSIPYKKDTDVTFQISCEGQGAVVALNLTSHVFEGHPGNWDWGLGHTKQMMVHTPCDSKGLRRVYLASEPGYAFGTDSNTTFYVRVSNFTTPITIQISFAQSPPINWVLFFVIFAACFIVLLVVAGLLWMIKLRIEVYRRNQNRINEIEHMASRPFSSVRLELSNPYTNMVATPVSIEPCSNYKAGVYTLAVRLPTGGRQITPNGTSGMAVASALCLLTPAQLAVLTAPENTENKNNRKRTLRSYIPFLRNNE